LEPNCEVAYKVTGYYSPQHDAGVQWADPDLGIAWPCGPEEALVSDKDAAAPRLCDIEPPF
jgi:dTDP-4-dehydrorhamnose 3,5-epimerase